MRTVGSGALVVAPWREPGFGIGSQMKSLALVLRLEVCPSGPPKLRGLVMETVRPDLGSSPVTGGFVPPPVGNQ